MPPDPELLLEAELVVDVGPAPELLFVAVEFPEAEVTLVVVFPPEPESVVDAVDAECPPAPWVELSDELPDEQAKAVDAATRSAICFEFIKSLWYDT